MKLRIAIQKSGRLYDESIRLLKECGIELTNGINKLRSEAHNFPLEVLFLRDDDIPQYVQDGAADVGIVGQNVIEEKEKAVALVEQLGFGKCRLSIAVPKDMLYDGCSSLQGKKIATSYPKIVQRFLDDKRISAEIHEISGSVEIAPGIGLADVICDLVSSGSTLFQNGLRETEVILRSEALLISNFALDPGKKELLEKLLFRIQSVKRARRYKYILLNTPNDKIAAICKLLPGMKSPTIIPLVEENWSSIHSVIHEDDFWNIIEKLKEQGAEGILVSAIEKLIV